MRAPNCQQAVPADHTQAGHSARTVDHSRRPRLVDDLKPVAFLLADLGVTKTHCRPHTSNDNPYSEAQFKTLKYCPEFPERFGSREDVRAFCQRFFTWYNSEHRHSGIGLLTPEDIHYGRAARVLAGRQNTLSACISATPRAVGEQAACATQSRQSQLGSNRRVP